MVFTQALGLRRGLTSVIGSGGKSTLLETLASELRAEHRVILCTTTHMFPASGMETVGEPDERRILELLCSDHAVCVGEPAQDGRLHSPRLPMSRLMELADFVLVEADGSKRLPLKAHAGHEPVIPAESSLTVCVVGLSGLGRPVREAVHRPELFPGGADGDVTVERLAEALNAEALGDIYFLNQCDVAGDGRAGRLARLLDKPCVAGSLQKGVVQCLF